MAEFAEQTLEEMIPEFEDLERIGLLTAKEVKKVIVKRRNFEYKLCKPRKEMQDFFAYSLYDTHLLDLLSIRRQKVLLRKKMHPIEVSIIQRVLKRLRMMSHLWPAHPTVWQFRLSFAKSKDFLEEVSTIYAEEVKFVGADEKVWVSWAQFEIEKRNNFEKGRNILLSRAPLYHPKSIFITKEYFRLELQYLEYLKKRNIETGGGGLDEIIAENREMVLQCAVPKAIFKNSLREFNSPEICLHFYWIAHEYLFAHQLRDLIFSKMVEMFPNSLEIYKLKAKLLMDGYIVEEIKTVDHEENATSAKDKIDTEYELTESVAMEDDEFTKSVEHKESEEETSEDEEAIEEDSSKSEDKERSEDEFSKIDEEEIKELTGSVEIKEDDKESIKTDDEIEEESSEDEEKSDDESSKIDEEHIEGVEMKEEHKEESAETIKKKTDRASVENNQNLTDSSQISLATIKIEFSPKQKLNELFTLYDLALSCHGPSVLETVIEDLFNILNQVWGLEEFRSVVAKKILEIFSSNSSSLTAAQFLIWVALASKEKCSKNTKKNILEMAREKYPCCQHIELVWLPFIGPLNLKNKLKLLGTLFGNVGADICFQLINRSKTNLQKERLIERACMHPDATLTKTMRVKILESFKELKDCRKHYEKFCSVPPFNVRLHTSMIKKELQATDVSEKNIRNIFHTAIQQFGHNQYELWICYIEFERKFGISKNVSRLQKEAEEQLKAKYLHDFTDSKYYLQSLLNKKMAKDNESVLVDCPKMTEDDSTFEFWSRSSLPNLLDNNVTITHTDEQNRMKFFASLAQIYKRLKESEGQPKEVTENEALEEILSLIIGENVSLNFKKVNLSEIGLDKDISSFINAVHNKNEKRSCGEVVKSSIISDETRKILESSDILKPEFLQQKQLVPYYLSRNSVKRHRKKERAKDVGEDWFKMKAPEITEEVERDLQVLKMRSILDPHIHYKRNDMKELPKYFQMGKVIDSPADFYSSRVTKKERKRTMAEEIMNDQAILSYQKRKFTELANAQNTKRKKRKLNSEESKQMRKREVEEKKRRKQLRLEERDQAGRKDNNLKAKLMKFL